jgi:large repetitive protein
MRDLADAAGVPFVLRSIRNVALESLGRLRPVRTVPTIAVVVAASALLAAQTASAGTPSHRDDPRFVATGFRVPLVAAFARLATADIDGDGVPEIFSGALSGDVVLFDDFDIVTNPFGLADVGTLSVPAFVDIDGDGDQDAFVGGATSPRLVYFENTGSATRPAFAAPIAAPFGMPAIPGIAFVDIDSDGDQDAFVPSRSGLALFRNVGSATAPDFAFAAVNPFGLSGITDLNATLVFIDFDADGDSDLFVGGSDGRISFYENTGSAGAAAFAAPVVDPFNLAEVGKGPVSPAFVDANGDGDVDVWVGDADGNMSLFLNVTTRFGAARINPFGLEGAARAKPVLVDIDADGDLDVFLGDDDGDILFYRNDLADGPPVLVGPTVNPFGLSNVGRCSALAFADLTGDGVLDLIVGNVDGEVRAYENQGSPQTPLFALAKTIATVTGGAAFALVDIDGDSDVDLFTGLPNGDTALQRNTSGPPDNVLDTAEINPFGLTNVGEFAVPAFVDIDFDGDLDAFIGSGNGTTTFFRNIGSRTDPQFAPGVTGFAGLESVGVNSAPALGDLDGDFDVDALIGGEQGQLFYFENKPPPSATSTPMPTDTPSPTPTGEPTGTPTQTPVGDTPTPTPAAGTPTPVTVCVGDCDGSGEVGISELIRGVNIALGSAVIDQCRPLDGNGDGTISINELILAVGNALAGCG